MPNAIETADAIYSDALQIMNHYGVLPDQIPLIMSMVSHRLEAFTISAMAQRINEIEQTSEKQKDEPESEVDNG